MFYPMSWIMATLAVSWMPHDIQTKGQTYLALYEKNNVSVMLTNRITVFSPQTTVNMKQKMGANNPCCPLGTTHSYFIFFRLFRTQHSQSLSLFLCVKVGSWLRLHSDITQVVKDSELHLSCLPAKSQPEFMTPQPLTDTATMLADKYCVALTSIKRLVNLGA